MKHAVVGMMVVSILVVGCGKRPADDDVDAIPVPKAFVNERPTGAPTPIPVARELQAGTEIVLQGQVMGVQSPFVDKRGVFILGDIETLRPCTDDHCSMPWDACCDPVEVRSQGTVTIQLLDDKGKVLAQGVKGANNLKELSKVTVTGTVAPSSSREAFIVNADAVYVEPEEKVN